jgi:hypothetical protein
MNNKWIVIAQRASKNVHIILMGSFTFLLLRVKLATPLLLAIVIPSHFVQYF